VLDHDRQCLQDMLDAARKVISYVSALEREIDELVYALYGLTAEEIKIVEDSAK
jgi:hypothetical protein